MRCSTSRKVFPAISSSTTRSSPAKASAISTNIAPILRSGCRSTSSCPTTRRRRTASAWRSSPDGGGANGLMEAVEVHDLRKGELAVDDAEVAIERVRRYAAGERGAEAERVSIVDVGGAFGHVLAGKHAVDVKRQGRSGADCDDVMPFAVVRIQDGAV